MYYQLREGFYVAFEPADAKSGRVNIIGLGYEDEIVLTGWEMIVEFVSLLECMLRRNLEMETDYEVGSITARLKRNESNKVVLEIQMGRYFENPELELDMFQCQKLASKLNKLLHSGNKFYGSQPLI